MMHLLNDGKGYNSLRYGLTQAFRIPALKRRKLMCEILVEEYDLPLILELFQSSPRAVTTL